MPSLAPITVAGTVTLAATTSTARVALAKNVLNQVMVSSPSASSLAFIKFGDSAVTAAITDTPILPGTQKVFTVPSDGSVTHIAAITGTSTATIYATSGEGQ